MCERLAQQGWLVKKIVKQARFSAGECVIRFRLAWQESDNEESLPIWRAPDGEVVKKVRFSKRSMGLPSIVRVLVVHHAGDASGNGSDRSTLGTAQKTSDRCASATAARDDQR